MYRNDRPHNASPKSGCPATATNMPQTFNKITGIIKNIYILSIMVVDYQSLYHNLGIVARSLCMPLDFY